MTRRARSFERGASAYDRLRPEFPEPMFDDLVRAAGDRLDAAVLEIGAGTGRATLPLARRGARIQVIEPSADMLRVLAQRLADERLQERVQLRRATFEELSPQDGPFGVVVAAQSFHWADPQTRWRRLAGLLGSDGLAFLCWNGWRLRPDAHDLDAVRELYQRHGPDLVPDIDDERSLTGWAQTEMAAEPLLEEANATHYSWDWTLPVDDYLALLSTTSQYAVAEPPVRDLLFEGLRGVLGNPVRLDGRTLLLTVRPSGQDLNRSAAPAATRDRPTIRPPS